MHTKKTDMNGLSDLQRVFCDALRSPETPPAQLLDQLLDDGLALQRFNVYRNNFVVLNGDALADMYPVVQRLVGAEAFRMLASAYVRQHPPQHRTLMFYGDRFAEFLAVVPELAGLPYLVDVARLEFAWLVSYHAEDAVPLAPTEIALVDPEDLDRVGLVPHPSLQCLRSKYPVLSIWQANQTDNCDEIVSLDQGGCRLLLVRPHMEVEISEVGEGEYNFLEQLRKGKPLASAYESAAGVEADFDLAKHLSRHLFNGTFVAVRRIDSGEVSAAPGRE